MMSLKVMLPALALWACGRAMRVRKEAALIQEVAQEYTESHKGNATAKQKKESACKGRMKRLTNNERALVTDFNQIGEGTIVGSHSLLVRIFGEEHDGESFIHFSDIQQIEVDREFPSHYVFGRGPSSNRRRRPVALDRPNHRRRNTKPNFIECGHRGGDGGRILCSNGETPYVEADLEFTNFIICPFLSTLVSEGALPVKQEYTKAELREATELAGLDEETAETHVDGNFLNNPIGTQDLWNMEGATNEHVTSTGISDCPTEITDCVGLWTTPRVEHPFELCKVFSTRKCRMPSRDKFHDLWYAVDIERDDYWSVKELTCFGERAVASGMAIDRDDDSINRRLRRPDQFWV